MNIPVSMSLSPDSRDMEAGIFNTPHKNNYFMPFFDIESI